MLLAVVSGCETGEHPTNAPWNVLLVTFDTTRADRIGCYGNDHVRTPTLDGLAASGIRFARAFSAAPITAPSHSTILTGRYPPTHGVRDNGLFVLGAEQLTLAEILQSHGYATGAAIGAYPLTARFGLNQGFDFYDDHLTGIYEDYLGERVHEKRDLFFDERRAAQVNEALLPWLDEHADRPFFAWVHYFDPHQPFEPAPPFNQQYADDLYDGEIAYADSRLGFLLDHLKRLGLLDRTLVVMTADHGEGLDEHGETTHALLAYDSTLHVPLLVRLPGDDAPTGVVIGQRVATVDIVPTILEVLGLALPEGLQGQSLVPLWTGRGRELRAQYAENLSPSLSHGWGELRVLYDGPLKYIHGPRPELYDVERDHAELHDLIDERSDDARRMRERLERFLREHAAENSSASGDLDPDVRRRLEALGYLHAEGAAPTEIVETLRDGGIPPQDRVYLLNDMTASKQLLLYGRPAQALPYIDRLVRAAPDSPLNRELQMAALMDLGRLDEAWKVLQHLRKLGEVSEPMMLRLAARRFEAGLREDSIGLVRQHAEASGSAQAYWLLGTMLDGTGDLAGAREALRTALERRPEFAPARVDLAVQHARAGELEAADREFRRALADAPYYAKAHYNYGTFVFNQSLPEKAVAAFDRAVTLAPTYLKARLGLIAAQLAAGRTEQAKNGFATLKRLAPDSEEARTAATFFADG